jgi:hypothetical protein
VAGTAGGWDQAKTQKNNATVGQIIRIEASFRTLRHLQGLVHLVCQSGPLVCERDSGRAQHPKMQIFKLVGGIVVL